MRDFLEDYLAGFEFLLSDDLVSYFTYFTTILIQIAYLWAFKVESALLFTILLALSIANVFVAAFWKSHVEGSKAEVVQAVAFVGTIVTLFIIGCTASFVTSLLLFGLPLLVTRIWIIIREFQNTSFIGYDSESATMKFSRFISNKLVYVLSYVITMLLPIVLLVVFTAMTALPIYLKILLPALYILISPYIALAEDEIATCSIFELMAPGGYLLEQDYKKNLKEYLSGNASDDRDFDNDDFDDDDSDEYDSDDDSDDDND